MRKATLRRDERLRGAKPLSALFKNPFSVKQYPFRIHWVLAQKSQTPVRTVFIVSSRKYRKAVTRNRIRRVMSELFRLNKEPLYSALGGRDIYVHMALMYQGEPDLGNWQVLPAYLRLMEKLKEDVQKRTH